MTSEPCLLCRGPEADAEIGRVQVWEDDLWQLAMSRSGYTTGFAYLEPKRHIPHVTDLSGEEAATFGHVLARVSSALKEAAGAELVYVYVFGGGVAHLHVHLAPHRRDDPLSANIIRGELAEEKLPGGATRLVSREFERLPPEEIEAVIARATELLSDRESAGG